MTKRSTEAKRVAQLPPKPAAERTPFTPSECVEIQEMQRLVNGRKFEASQVKGNTALVPNGQRVAEELAAIARLLENTKNLWISEKLIEHGYPHDSKCDINLSTGEVVVSSEDKKEDDSGPTDSSKTA